MRKVATTAAAAAALALAVTVPTSNGFTTPACFVGNDHGSNAASVMTRFSEDPTKATPTEAVFLPPEEPEAPAETVVEEEVVPTESTIDLDTVEMLGRGAAKVKRGKRKGAPAAASTSAAKKKAAATLAPEEVFYEGPPAITETIVPTISILTVIGIIPAAAAWARQAWVRYKITTRRIRVTSGINGNDMAEIVYPDIVEIRTAKRLFGDGDMVAFLRDGARFEMRNIPEFDSAMEFILQQVDDDVVKKYREEGDVTNPK